MKSEETSKSTSADPFVAILDLMKSTHDRKQQDYGTKGDEYANCRSAEDFGVPAWVGVAIRMQDKMKRIQSFAKKGILANEGIEDAFLDLAVYAVIALVLYGESTKPKPGAIVERP